MITVIIGAVRALCENAPHGLLGHRCWTPNSCRGADAVRARRTNPLRGLRPPSPSETAPAAPVPCPAPQAKHSSGEASGSSHGSDARPFHKPKPTPRPLTARPPQAPPKQLSPKAQTAIASRPHTGHYSRRAAARGSVDSIPECSVGDVYAQSEGWLKPAEPPGALDLLPPDPVVLRQPQSRPSTSTKRYGPWGRRVCVLMCAQTSIRVPFTGLGGEQGFAWRGGGGGGIGAVPERLQSGHRGCESGWGRRFLAVGNAVGRPENCFAGGGGGGWHGRPAKEGGGVPEMGSRAGPLVFCKDGCCHQRRRNTNFGPEKFLSPKNFPPRMCSQNDQRDVGIILRHVCWGRTPPPRHGR